MRYLLALSILLSPLAAYGHGGGLNACGCHFNRKTGQCHCHRPKGCGCECEPARCSKKGDQRADADQCAEPKDERRTKAKGEA